MQDVSSAMIDTLTKLRGVCATAVVGGSDLVKIRKHLEHFGFNGELDNFIWSFMGARSGFASESPSLSA